MNLKYCPYLSFKMFFFGKDNRHTVALSKTVIMKNTTTFQCGMKTNLLRYILVILLPLSVAAQTITVTYPNGGENLLVGQNINITWVSSGTSGLVKIEAYNSLFFNWVTLAASVTDNGSYAYTVTAVPGSQGKIRITDVANAAVTDQSDGMFNIVNAGLAVTSATYNDISCYGLSDGILMVNVSGGTSPYQYSIDGGLTFQTSGTFTGLAAGTYTVLIEDAASNSVDTTLSISEPGALVFDSIVIQQQVTCFGGADGAACIFVSGGVAPYSFSIGPITTSCYTAMAVGNYNCVVADAAGCQVDSVVTITGPTHPINLNIVSETTDGAPDTLTVSPSGGIEPYTIDWKNATNQLVGEGDTVVNVYYTNSIYEVACYDSLGCAITYTYNNTSLPGNCNIDTILANVSDSICFPMGVVDSISILTPPQHGTLSFYNQLCLSYTSLSAYTGDDFFELQIHYLGSTTADVAAYCFFIEPNCTNQCVWPGDADYNGLADNSDLLYIGLGYGVSGIARAQQDIDWYSHAAIDWADTLADGDNYKHIDCDGNGLVGADDTLAILQNYSLGHPRGGADEPRGNVPALRIQMVPDTLADGETVLAHLLLGDSVFGATNVYGLAFTFNFDPLVVDSNEYSISFSNNSWLCNTASDHIDIDKKLFAAGQIQTALTRIDHSTRNGSGEIATVSMKITTGNINGKDLSYYAMSCFISDLTVIDNNGNHLTVDAGSDTAQVAFEPLSTGELPLTSTGCQVYPNPATNRLNIATAGRSIDEVEVFNLIGEKIIHQPQLQTSLYGLDIAMLNRGVYILKVSAGKQQFYTRFVKLK